MTTALPSYTTSRDVTTNVRHSLWFKAHLMTQRNDLTAANPSINQRIQL